MTSAARRWGLIFGFLVTGCFEGRVDPPFDGGEVAAECEAALTAFEANIQPAIDISNSCGGGGTGCHGTGGGGLTLTPSGDVATNRSNLLAVVNNKYGGSAESFHEKVSGEPSHNGGDQSGNLSLDATTAWLNEEANCP